MKLGELSQTAQLGRNRTTKLISVHTSIRKKVQESNFGGKRTLKAVFEKEEPLEVGHLANSIIEFSLEQVVTNVQKDEGKLVVREEYFRDGTGQHVAVEFEASQVT